MSGFDLQGLSGIIKDVTTQVADVASSVANAKFSWAERNLDLKLKQSQILQANNQIKLQNTIADTNNQIAILQAKHALTQAQSQANSIDMWSSDEISNAIGSLNAKINGLNSGGGNLMLWLTLAGVAFAGLQYFKGRR